MAGLTYRTTGGELRDVPEVSATEAKNSFGRVLEAALAQGAVAITKHDEPRAVLMSVQAYQALFEAQSSPLAELTQEFDALLAHLQAPPMREAMADAFAADSAELGAAALAAAQAGKPHSATPPPAWRGYADPAIG
jgi:prevent-host-death family protein